MVSLRYMGRIPDSDAIIVPKVSADTLIAAGVVTPSYVADQIGMQGDYLTNQAYVDGRDVLRAHKSAVLAADNTAALATTLGATVATLDSGQKLAAAQTPSTGILRDRVIRCVTASDIRLSPGAWHTTTTTGLREFLLASVTLPVDPTAGGPSFPWRPLPFGSVRGNSSGGMAVLSRTWGNGNFGFLAVMPPSGVSNHVYGAGLCTASPSTNAYPVIPYASVTQLPTTDVSVGVPPIMPVVGAPPLVLGLYGSCYLGNTYTYYGDDLVFYCLVVPAIQETSSR